MRNNIDVPRRYLHLLIGVLAAALGLWLAGCGGEQGQQAGGPEAGAGPGLLATDAGVTYCEIPSPSGDLTYTYSNGSRSPYTMREWYYRAAEAGAYGYWGVLADAQDIASRCASSGASAAECSGLASDPSRYCVLADCSWDQASGRFACRLGAAVVGRWDGDSRGVASALCDPLGTFAGWLCSHH